MPDGLTLRAGRTAGLRPTGAGPDASSAKRGLDVGATLVLLLILLPLLLLLAAAVRLDGGPVLYGHRRMGRGGREFPCWKFRSMRPDAEAALAALLAADPAARAEWNSHRKLRHDPRITPFGRFLRVSSLDELPQLWNVLRGDMSLVGPRPVTRDELQSHYGPHASTYSLVRPGITGPWQVSGRSDTDYPSRVALDVQYVRSRSLGGDLTLLGRTVAAVLRGRGAR